MTWVHTMLGQPCQNDKFVHAPPVPPSLLHPLAAPGLDCLRAPNFSSIFCSWHHTVWNLFRLASFNKMHVNFLCVFLWLESLFLLIPETYFLVWMSHSLFIHPPAEHLGCVQVLAIVDKAALNFYVQVFVWP